MVRPLILAHRGHRPAGPENSLRSVFAAFEVADGAEVDVLVTADGLPVLRHDERLADGTPIRCLSLSEARRILRADADDLPLVADAFRRLEGVRGTLDVELKVPGAVRAIRAAGSVPACVVFSSFLASEVIEALGLFPDRAAGLLVANEVPLLVPAGTSFLAVEHRLLPAVREAFPAATLWAWTVNDEAAAARAREAVCAAWITDDAVAWRREGFGRG